MSPSHSQTSQTPRDNRLYAAVWRWHFYAGLITAPFLLILAITGAIYLFNDEINDLLHPDLRFAPTGNQVQAPGALLEAVQHAYPAATLNRIDMPTEPGRTAQIYISPAQGPDRRVFVDPGNAAVLGSYVYTSTLVGFSDVAHGSLLLGNTGDAIVELVACWAFVLVITGLYLWWPRKRTDQRHRFSPNLQQRGRKLWRELHRLTGLYSAVLILFLIITGLPWANLWGGQFLTPVSNALGMGYPTFLRHHGSDDSKTLVDTHGEAPWTLNAAPVPHGHHGASNVSVNQVHQILVEQGVALGYRLSLPQEPGDIYSAYTYPAQPEGQQTFHIDAHNGTLIGKAGFDDYGAIAKIVEWGVALHMGNYFGRANQLLMLFPCLAIIILVVSGLKLWWKRRPQGSLGAPKKLAAGKKRNLAMITAILMLLFPLAGISFIIVLTVDMSWQAIRSQ